MIPSHYEHTEDLSVNEMEFVDRLQHFFDELTPNTIICISDLSEKCGVPANRIPKAIQYIREQMNRTYIITGSSKGLRNSYDQPTQLQYLESRQKDAESRTKACIKLQEHIFRIHSPNGGIQIDMELQTYGGDK